MASYGRLPNSEHDAEGLAPTYAPDSRIAKSNLSYSAAAYVQVPLSDDSTSMKPVQQRVGHRNRVSTLSVHPILLIALAIFFAGAALSTGLLYHYSEQDHGISTQISAHRYAWLYGPTAIMVMVQVIWRLIDLKTKATMPWHELAQGPAPAHKSILLEYISSGIVRNLWKSVKNRHWPVTMTIAGHLLVLLATVFVTGLFTLEPTTVTIDRIPLLSNNFDASSFDVGKLDASRALLSLAIQTQNLSYPKGTSQDTVVPLFDSNVRQPDDTVTQAVVKGMKVSLECDVLDIHNSTKVYQPWVSIRAPIFLINVTTPDCNIINARVGEGPDHGDVQNRNSTQSYQGWMQNYVCNSGLDTSVPWGMNATKYANESAWLASQNQRNSDNRLLLSVTEFGNLPQAAVGDVPPMWVESFTAVLCKPSYSMNNYRVSYSRNGTGTHMEYLSGTNDTLPNFYPADISKSLQFVYNDKSHLYIGLGGVDFQFTQDNVQPVTQMLTLLHGGEKANYSLKDLTDSQALKSTSETLLTGTMAQIVNQKLLTSMSTAPVEGFTGSISYALDRLHVKPLSVGFLCGCFTLLLVLCIVLLFTSPQKPALAGDLGSILAVAFALRFHPDLSQFFLNTDPKAVEKHSESMRFFSRSQPQSGTIGLDIVPISDKVSLPTSQDVTPDKSGKEGEEWWQPPTSRGWFIGLAVVLCAIIIAVLEVIQHISDKNQGFVNVKKNGGNTAVFSQYIPAAIALLIVWMFSDIEKMVATFSSFRTLKKGSGTASQTIALDYCTKSGADNFFMSIRNRHCALAVVLLTTFVASFLTIVIPGLYSRQSVGEVSAATMIVADQFKLNGVDIGYDDKRAGTMLNLMTYYNISYPTWTYDDLAFPQLHLSGAPPTSSDDLDQPTALIKTRVTALRPKLECQPAPGPLAWSGEPKVPNIAALGYFPWSMCSNPPPLDTVNVTTPWANLEITTNKTFAPGAQHFMGISGIMIWGQYETAFWNEEPPELPGGTLFDYISLYNGVLLAEGIYPEPVELFQWGCPSLIFAMGSAVFDVEGTGNSTAAKNITANSIDINTLVCRQHLQSVETDITLEYPSMAIAQSSPPVPDEATATWLENLDDSKHGTAFQFAPSNMFLSLTNPDIENNGTTANLTADRFTQALLYMAQKEDGLDIKDIAGSANSDTFYKLVQRLYARYMAQAISNNMREDIVNGNVSQYATTSALWTSTASPVVSQSVGYSYTNRVVATPSSAKVGTVSVSGQSRGSSQQTMAASQTQSRSAAASTPFLPTGISWINGPSAIPTNSKQAAQKRSDNASPNSKSPTTLPATTTQINSSTTTRLRQNRAPKLALQIMLGLIMLGAIVTKLLLHTKETLQREPYSIAGRAILVVNGNLLELMQYGAPEVVLFGGRKFRLGWWEDGAAKLGGGGRWRYGVVAEM